MARSLLVLPVEIWHDALFSWLGNLREIVRIDCALSFANSDHALRVVYASGGFRFAYEECGSQRAVLAKLCSWMSLRNVHFSCLKLTEKREPLTPCWESMLVKSADTLQSLSVHCRNTDALSRVLCNESKLRNLRISTKHLIDETGAAEEAIRCNSSSLESLAMNGIDLPLSLVADSVYYPCLRTLKCGYNCA